MRQGCAPAQEMDRGGRECACNHQPVIDRGVTEEPAHHHQRCPDKPQHHQIARWNIGSANEQGPALGAVDDFVGVEAGNTVAIHGGDLQMAGAACHPD